MSFAPNRRPGGSRKAPKFRLRASGSRVRLRVSHRSTEGTWRAPEKATDVLHERDLMPVGAGDSDTQRLRRG